MNKLTSIFFFCLCLGLNLQAQKAAKDPNNIYISEYHYQIAPEENIFENQAKGLEGKANINKRLKRSGYLLKYQQLVENPYQLSGDREPKLAAYILRALYNKEIKAYKDAKLTKVYSEQELNKRIHTIDTVQAFDPNTFENFIKVVESQLSAGDILGFEQFGYLYYNKETGLFQPEVKSIGLIFGYLTKKGKVREKKLIAWLPVSEIKSYSVNSPSIQWAARTKADVELGLKCMKSNRYREDATEDLIKQAPKLAEQGKIYDFQNQKIAKENLKLSTIDTIISFDQETFEEIINVVKSELNSDDINNIRLIQDWIWDEKKKQIQIYNHSFGPIINRYDDNGNFLNSSPIFYIKL